MGSQKAVEPVCSGLEPVCHVASKNGAELTVIGVDERLLVVGDVLDISRLVFRRRRLVLVGAVVIYLFI